jgi:RNA polymerase sigma-70 factor (ECF subfamily)
VADSILGLPIDALTPEVLTLRDNLPEVRPEERRDEDAALLSGLRHGDECAYEALIVRYEQPVYSIVSRLVDNVADAADVVQEVFLKVFRNVGSFRGDSTLKTWIYRIAVNEARNHHRWFGRHCRQEVGLESADEERHGLGDCLADPGPGPHELAVDRETQILLEAALAEVNPSFRAALILREIEGLSYEEIAGVLEISLGTVKSRILRGREALRKALAHRLESSRAPLWRLEEERARMAV